MLSSTRHFLHEILSMSGSQYWAVGGEYIDKMAGMPPRRIPRPDATEQANS
jgi:hypothetical protein